MHTTFKHGLLVCGALWLQDSPAWGQDAACCLRSTSQAAAAFQSAGQDPDERYFKVSGVAPNLMFLFDNSCSMNDLPIDPDSARSSGTRCTNAVYDALLAARGFDQASGHHPPPDLGVAPCPDAGCWSGDPGFPQLFRQDSYYRNGEWDRATATARTASSACSNTSNTDECQVCVQTRGYYLDPVSSSSSRQVFSGKFLNVYPPKYVAARTVLKQVVWEAKNMRMGVTVFNSVSTGGTLLVPLKPDCDKLDQPEHPDWESTRRGIITAVNAVDYSANTPLAETLLNIGQYFSTDNSVYDGWFGPGWTHSGFNNASLDSQSRSVCFGCQLSNTVVITDGAPCSDNCVPQCIKQASPPRCPGCDTHCGCQGSCPNACGGGSTCSAAGSSDCCSGSTNYLDAVAKWMFTNDLQHRSPSSGAWDAAGTQRMSTYAVGFGIDHPLLGQTAAVGGGRYFSVNDSSGLQDALLTVINEVSKRATTFGVSSVSTLQTSGGVNALVPRFVPGSNHERWKGLLFRFSMESELTNGCEESTPPHPKDLDLDGKCRTLFYVDRDNDLVVEEPITGKFIKRASGLPARPLWEAGRELTYQHPTYAEPETAPVRDPDTRNLWTVIDSNNDGRFDRLDTMVEFKTANAALLMKYMAISTDVSLDPVCRHLHAKLGVTSPLSSWGEECARTIIEFYRGKQSTDVDPAKRNSPQPWLLADIFHSSPVLVEPPIAEEGCPFFRGQCLASLYSYGGKVSRDASAAYKAYVTSPAGPCGGGIPCERRRALVLVGSNGGFIHAFDAGGPRLPLTRQAVTERLEYDEGSGIEVWGFVPPDLLGVMKQSLDSPHPYFVDGTAMVRDVWVDDPTLGQGNGSKESGEFHTVAVIGERGGGHHFFALDLTDNVDGSAIKRPKFLWMWPQPCDPEASWVGETWSNFHPKPPPIGPVVLNASAGPLAGYPGFNFSYRRYNPGTSAWESASTSGAERWVVMLNGGHDRALLRGRGFAMIDVYSGKPLWTEFHDPLGSSLRQQLKYPVGAGIAMLDVGAGEVGRQDLHDGYFDLANFGDWGGTLWTARFYEPGVVDNSGRVTNWHLARAFESRRETGADLTHRRPISFITANALQNSTGYVRTFFGTGDRHALLDRGGSQCSMDNLGACIAMGCRVGTRLLSHHSEVASSWSGQAMTTSKRGPAPCVNAACFDTWRQGCSEHCSETHCTSAAPCPSCAGRLACSTVGRSSCAGACPNACAESRTYYETVVENCPGTTVSNPVSLRRDVQYGCNQSNGGSTLGCESVLHHNDLQTLHYLGSAVPALTPHRYLGVHTFGGGTPPRVFSDFTGALAYDALRRTETDLTHLGTLSSPLSQVGTEFGPGWYVDYDHPDERTASPGGLTFAQGLESGCVLWNTMSPGASNGQCGGAGQQLARLIQADAITGAPDCAAGFLQVDGGTSRYQARSVLVPPPEPTPVISVNGGEVTYSVVTAEPGNSAQSTRTASEYDVLQSVYQLELSEAEHLCRHRTGGATCNR